MLTLASEILAEAGTHPDPAVRAQLVLGLARASGAAGMVGGQQLDLEAEGSAPGLHTATGVQAIQDMKTGALIRFSACAGAILASASAADMQALATYGGAIGAAFQIADDLLDAGGEAAQIGKRTGKDAQAGKATWISILGIEGARARLAQLERDAATAVSVFGARGDILAQAATFVARRQKKILSSSVRVSRGRIAHPVGPSTKLVEVISDWSFRHILCWIPEAAPASPSPLEDDERIEIVLDTFAAPTPTRCVAECCRRITSRRSQVALIEMPGWGLGGRQPNAGYQSCPWSRVIPRRVAGFVSLPLCLPRSVS